MLCKYCQTTTIYYDDAKGCWAEVETRRRHVCQKRDFSHYVRVEKEEFQACSFCHRTDGDKASIYHRQPGRKEGQQINARTVICDSCVQKCFRALVQADEVEVSEH